MNPLPLFIFLATIVFSGVFSSSPGDPFPPDLDDLIDLSFLINRSNASNSTSTPISTMGLTTEEKTTMLTTELPTSSTENLTTTTTMVTSSPTPRIDRNDLIEIAQWKFTDPKTNHTRYWYHRADSEMGSGWQDDGIVLLAYSEQKPNTVPVHLFHSESKGIWTNTVQLEASPPTLGNNHWKYDGVLFYAYNSSMHAPLSTPVWRYWNRINYGTEDVRQPRRAFLCTGKLINNDLPEWVLDRSLFYVFSPDLHL